MIPAGVSPTEAAFEVIGLVNAKSIIDFLFFDTSCGEFEPVSTEPKTESYITNN